MDDAPPTPYRDAAPIYRRAGWAGVLPIPYGTKRLLMTGWTGHQGAWPSNADIYAWCENDNPREGGGNIALRLSPGVIGIDVDAYNGKDGAATLAAAEERWGKLPPTWTTTARDDGTSGIRLYRVPDGLKWPGQLPFGGNVEIIQPNHRYAMVSPSVHPEGPRYRWIRPDGITSTAPPEPDDLPELPAAWVEGLTGGEHADDVQIADMSTGAVRTWIADHQRGNPCGAMTTTLGKALAELQTGSAHEALRRLFGLARLAEQGHTGFASALQQLHASFRNEVTRTDRPAGRRTLDEADAELQRSLAGAVRRVVGSPAVGPDEDPPDPCADPFASIVEPGAITPAPPPLAGPAGLPPAPAPLPPPDSAQGIEQAPSGTLGMAGDTWKRRDLSAALNGGAETPTVLQRSDKRALFYPGKVNALIGESESGKSWIALLAVAQEVEAGRNIVYIDCEDTERTLVNRLTALGVPVDVLVERIAYISPDEPLSTPAAAILAAELADTDPSLVVLDGVNAAMSLFGFESNSTTDVTRFAQVLLARLVANGAAAVVIDHVSKNKETRGKGGIGSQAKRAMISGASITAETVKPFGRGMTGTIKLIVDKDRPGGVREHSAFGKSPGTVHLRSQIDPDRVDITIEPGDDRPVSERPGFRPTAIMERVSRYLAAEAEQRSTRQIEDAVKGKRDAIGPALQALTEGRWIEQSEGPRRAKLYRHVNLYRELDDMVETGDE